MRSPPDTPGQVSPALEIELSQSENQFYHPGGLVSGNVHYAHPQDIDKFELTMTFYGVNQTFISASAKKPFQEAVLFKYETCLHNGAAPRNRSGQQHVAPMDFYFKWRFPSVAENRQFSQCFGAVGGHIWENSRHALPPSFNGTVPFDRAERGVKNCCVEYALEAKLCYNNTLVAIKKLPVVFLPSRTSSNEPSSHVAFNYSPTFGDGGEMRDSLIGKQRSGFRVQCPDKVVQGQSFNISIYVAFDPLNLPVDFVSRLVDMEITKLVMVCNISVRAAGVQIGHTLTPTAQEERGPQRRQIRPASLLTAPQPRINADGSHELEFVFRANMPSYYHSTFRTFLIANNYCFESPVEVTVDGRTIELPIGAPEFVVLSCYTSPNTKRPAFMTPSVPSGRTGGFCTNTLAERRYARV